MGYCYGVNYATGRVVLCCDVCGDARGTTIKVRCPYGGCPSVAACKACRVAKKHLHSAEQKASCKESTRIYDERKALEDSQPENVVKAAWGEWCTKQSGVTLVVTGDDKYHLVKDYEVRSPNWMSDCTYVQALTNAEAAAIKALGYATL